MPRLETLCLLDLEQAREVGIHALRALLAGAGVQKMANCAHQLTQALHLLSLGILSLDPNNCCQALQTYGGCRSSHCSTISNACKARTRCLDNCSSGRASKDAYLRQQLGDAAVHDLLCQHSMLVQVSNELDIAKGSSTSLHHIRGSAMLDEECLRRGGGTMPLCKGTAGSANAKGTLRDACVRP